MWLASLLRDLCLVHIVISNMLADTEFLPCIVTYGYYTKKTKQKKCITAIEKCRNLNY